MSEEPLAEAVLNRLTALAKAVLELVSEVKSMAKQLNELEAKSNAEGHSETVGTSGRNLT